jgi:tellurite resistance protein
MLHKVELLRAACCMAGLDGNISEPELVIIKKLASDAGVGAASLKAMMDRAKTDPNYYEQQFRFLRGNPDESMKMMLRVAIADGALHPNERVVLQFYATTLGLGDERYQQLLAAAEQALGTGSKDVP